MFHKNPPIQTFQAINPFLKSKPPKHSENKIYDDFPLKTNFQLPTLSLDEDTDYEADEKENYRSFWPFHKIIFFICFYFIKFFGNKKPFKTHCFVCYENFSPKRLIKCSLGHQICGKCIRKIARNSSFLSPIETLIKGFPCSEYKCDKYINYEKCTKILPKRTRRHIQIKMYEALLKIAEIKFEKCQKCDYLAEIPTTHLGMKIFKCPQCTYTFCCDCGKKCDCKHSKTNCFEDSKLLNEAYTNALIHRCHICALPFIKETGLFEGCNTITCKCGASQCYGCRKPRCDRKSCQKGGYFGEKIHKMDIEAAVANMSSSYKFYRPKKV